MVRGKAAPSRHKRNKGSIGNRWQVAKRTRVVEWTCQEKRSYQSTQSDGDQAEPTHLTLPSLTYILYLYTEKERKEQLSVDRKVQLGNSSRRPSAPRHEQTSCWGSQLSGKQRSQGLNCWWCTWCSHVPKSYQRSHSSRRKQKQEPTFPAEQPPASKLLSLKIFLNSNPTSPATVYLWKPSHFAMFTRRNRD